MFADLSGFLRMYAFSALHSCSAKYFRCSVSDPGLHCKRCFIDLWDMLVCSQTLACPLSRRFKSLNDINSNHYLLFHSGTRWLSFWLDFMAAVMTLLVALFIVLSDNGVISPALKGLALSYTIQVNLDSK